MFLPAPWRISTVITENKTMGNTDSCCVRESHEEHKTEHKRVKLARDELRTIENEKNREEKELHPVRLS